MRKNHCHSRNPYLFLIKRLIRLAYLYEHNPALFYRKFTKAVHVESLREYGIYEEILKEDEPILNLTEGRLDDKEAELFNFISRGFSAQELSVIYGMKNINSVYVKKHRIQKKIEGQCDPEVALTVLAWLLLGWVICYLLNLSITCQ